MKAPEGSIYCGPMPELSPGVRQPRRLPGRSPRGLEWLWPGNMVDWNNGRHEFIRGRLTEPVIEGGPLTVQDPKIRVFWSDGWPYTTFRIELPSGEPLQRSDGEVYWSTELANAQYMAQKVAALSSGQRPPDAVSWCPDSTIPDVCFD